MFVLSRTKDAIFRATVPITPAALESRMKKFIGSQVHSIVDLTFIILSFEDLWTRLVSHYPWSRDSRRN
jgi:hypothetical protein